MSNPKRRSIRQISASASHPHHTSSHLRGRLRQQAYPPSSVSSASSPAPVPVKKRKTRHATQQTELFAIKDIVDEKFVGSKRFYKIDWENNSVTGESYQPTWVR